MDRKNLLIAMLSILVVLLISATYINNKQSVPVVSQNTNSKPNTNTIPVVQKTDTSSAVNNSADANNISIINKYYQLLSSQKLDEAYAMRASQDISFKEFSGWYKDIEYARPDKFKSIGDNTYDFIVNYKDKNQDPKNYGVRMTVIGDKIKTESSLEFIALQTKFSEYSAFSVLRGDKIYLILEKGGKETIIDQGDAKLNNDMSNLDKAKDFSKLEFSPNGHYLLYSRTGYEWIGSYVYDITTGKKVFQGDGVSIGEDGFNFTPDEKYFYMCSSNEFVGSVTGEVYTVPDFKKIFDASKGNESYYLGKCSYDQKTNAVVFTLDNPRQDSSSPLRTKVVRYNLDGKILP